MALTRTIILGPQEGGCVLTENLEAESAVDGLWSN